MERMVLSECVSIAAHSWRILITVVLMVREGGICDLCMHEIAELSRLGVHCTYVLPVGIDIERLTPHVG